MTDTSNIIRIAAAVLVGADGRVLVVRKRGTGLFMQPGGKIEPGEAPLEALVRELREELDLAIAPVAATYLGRFSAPAAHEAGATVVAEVFRVAIAVEPHPQAEIVETRWIDPADSGALPLAILSRDHILPAHLRSH